MSNFSDLYVFAGSITVFDINSLFSFRQAELTFCAGDVITVFGEIDEDGFYYVSISQCFKHVSREDHHLRTVCIVQLITKRKMMT